ncbi:MAG: NUDIX domain-containing protein [Anaerolineales bacterium]
MPNPNDSRCLLASLVIVEQEGRYLLIKESKEACRNKWFLPGGRAMPDESMIQAAVRESKEESGMDVELTGLLFLDQLIDSDPTKSGNRIRFVFLGKPTGGELKQSEDEHSICAGWFCEAEAARLELRSPFVLDILKIRRESPAILSISRIHILAQKDLHRERP